MAGNKTLCPAPFVDLALFPVHERYTDGRFCGEISATLSCCLPCPLTQWVYSDSIYRKTEIANWFNIPALVCQVFLLVTFAVLPQEKVHGRYLSVGLCVSLVLLELAFIIPLGTRPDQCYNEITPKDMYSSVSCAFTGALMEVGSMAICVWILLRSLYTHLRVCWDVELTSVFTWIAHILGWGLPALFLAISLPVTGVSYRLMSTCSPNPYAAFTTWFGWLMAFALLGALIQFSTTGFCLIVYARSLFKQHAPTITILKTTSTSDSETPIGPGGVQMDPMQVSNARLAWRRVKKILALQWRSILLGFAVVNVAIYAGVMFVVLTTAENQVTTPSKTNEIEAWSECLVENVGDKDRCLDLAEPLRLGEPEVVAALFMASLLGIFTFALMIRWSMVVGWWELIRDPSQVWRKDSVDFDLISPGGPKHLSLSRPLASESAVEDAELGSKRLSAPEPGNVTKRRETTNLFEFGFDGEGENESKRVKQDDIV